MERLIVFKFTPDQLQKFRCAYNEAEVSRIMSNNQPTRIIVEDKLCAWCLCGITGIPKYIYRDLDGKRSDKLGQFCDNIICQFAFNKYYCNGIYWEFIRTEYFNNTGVVICKVIYPDPPQMVLQRFGGDRTVDEYKKYMQQLERAINT